MKLYTQEQVIKMTRAAFVSGQNHNSFIFEEEIKGITPIELPSDKEMDKFLLDNSYEYGYGFKDAINWIKKQIQKQLLTDIMEADQKDGLYDENK